MKKNGKWKTDKAMCLKKNFFVKAEAIPILAFLLLLYFTCLELLWTWDWRERGLYGMVKRQGLPREMANDITDSRNGQQIAR